MGENVEVVERGGGGVDEDVGAVAAGEGGDGGDVGGLKERVGGHLGDDAGDTGAVGGEDAGDGVEIERVADVNVVGGRRGEFFEDGDGIEVEPAELNPDGAAAAGLQVGDGAEGGVDGAHAAVGEKKIGVGDGRGGGREVGVEDAADVAADFGGGIAGECGLGINGGAESEADEVILGLAGGEEAAEVLQIGLGEGGEGGVGGGVGDAVEAVSVDKKVGGAGGGGGEVGDEILGDGEGRGEPELMAGESGVGGDVMRGELERERMNDEARVAGGELADDLRVFLLVAADGVHRGQAARNGMRAGRDGGTEGQMGEGGRHKMRAERFGERTA